MRAGKRAAGPSRRSSGTGDVGRQVSLLLTVEVAGEPHEYLFTFNIAPQANG